MKKYAVRILLMMIAILAMFTINTYAVNLNIQQMNENTVSISLQTDERNCKSSTS